MTSSTSRMMMSVGLFCYVALALLLCQPRLAAEGVLDHSKTYFLKEEDRFNVATQSALNLHDALPVGSYTVGLYPTGQYYLKEIQPFDLSSKKLYGDTERHGRRILDTFKTREGSTGVLLAGEKGSGKTLLAKYISVEAAKEGISTVVINEAWSGERFNAFIQSIRQPAIVLFDEFEKVYRQSAEVEMSDSSRRSLAHHHYGDYMGEYGDAEEGPNPSQDAILTLLDGVYPSSMLFLLTVNDKTKITKNMKNRPGRIFYVLDFAGLELDFVRDYCNDNLQNTTYVSEVVSTASLFDAFSFDMLQAIVEEMNKYAESPEEVLKWLNVKLEKSESRQDNYLIKKLVIDGKDLTKATHVPVWTGSPSTADLVSIHVMNRGWVKGYQDYSVCFSPMHHLVSGNITSGEFVFHDEDRQSTAILMKLSKKDPMSLARMLVT